MGAKGSNEIVLWALLATVSGASLAQPAPSNDNCSAPQALVLWSPLDGTLTSAASDYALSPGATACFSGVGNSASTASGRDVVYSFRAPGQGHFNFRVSHSGSLNPLLYVSPACPAAPATVTECLVAANRRGTASPAAEAVPCLHLDTGQQVFVYVDEATAGATGAFRIEAGRCDPELEPNDTPAQTVFDFGPRTGSIGTPGDVDFYRFSASDVGGSRLYAIVDGAAANSSDFDLRVTTATDTLEYDDLNNDVAFGALGPNIAGTYLPEPGQFYLRVSHFNAAAQAEPYQLYFVRRYAFILAQTESEPNGTTATANGHPDGHFVGNLPGPAPSSDVDVFRMQAAAGDLIFASLDGDPGRNATPLNARLELLDGADNVLLAVNDGGATSNNTPSPGTLSGSTPFSPAEGLLYRVPVGAPGSYYVRVSIGTGGADATGAGDYVLSLAVNPSFLKGDMNVDGYTDLVLRYGPTGQTDIWPMVGNTRSAEPMTVNPTPSNPAQQIVGIDDFDGDLQNDLVLWDSTTGQVDFWRLSGSERVGAPVPLGGAAPLAVNWRLSATADFNADRTPDIVWRNVTSQRIVVWLMNGTARQAAVTPVPDQAVDANWEIVAAIDYSGDHLPDFLWYNSASGKLVQWLMNADLVRVAGRFTNPPSAGDNNWKVTAGGQFLGGPAAGWGGHGANDVVWRNADSGRLVVWYLNWDGQRTAGQFTVPDAPSPDPAGWLLVGPR